MSALTLSPRDLDNWLDLLLGSHAGAIKLINTYLSLEHKLVSRDCLRSFLLDCVSHGAKTPDDAMAGFIKICGDDKYCAIASVSSGTISGTSILVTTMRSSVFHQYILRRPKTRVKFMPLEEPKSHDVSDEDAYRRALERMSSRRDWYRDTGTLGVPGRDPHHVWFTDAKYIDTAKPAGSSAVKETKATRIRDELGMVDIRDNTYILSLRLPAGVLHAVPDLKMARPGFADRGNTRFAVYLNKKGESWYRNNWGLTVHLGKLRAKPNKEINGAPERICLAIPLSHIGDSIQVEPLGWVVGTRGGEIGIDDDEAFIRRLR
jgi:hypothetical protein